MHTRIGWLAVGALLAGTVVAAQAAAPATKPAPPQIVLSPEGNHLWAYDAASGAPQLVSRAQNGDDPGAAAPVGSPRRDINGQVCVSPDRRHVITGEDTVFAAANGGDGGSSHDPRIAGWGYFQIGGGKIGDIRIKQVGKLAPEAGRGPGYTGDPDNYGCGFLDNRRLLTTAIGNTLPGEPANGQLILWFGPFTRGFRPAKTAGGTGFLVGEVDHCEIDHTLATAGGITVDINGDVYVATNRPDDAGNAGGVWRYRGRWPRSMAECTPAFLKKNIVKTQIVPQVAGVPADPTAPTPSSVVISPDNTLYVASVFSGTVSEFSKAGLWLRDIWPTSPVAPRRGPTSETPFGLAVTRDGSLWIADLGIVFNGPVPGQGSVVRVGFDAGRNPRPLGETVASGLTFPDGLGVYTPPAPTPRRGRATSEWGCGDWGMYGRTLSRQFSSDCATAISPTTVAGLVPAWTFRVPADPADQGTFTASPVVVDRTVYIGGWNGVMYALDLDDGHVIWEYQTPVAKGATYGPIVSSAAVTDVVTGNKTQRLVIVGSGPRLYAFHAATGKVAWVRYLAAGIADDPGEVQSSPLVYDDTVYVGFDVHNKPGRLTGGRRGGLIALDVRSGKVKWRYEPEAKAKQPASGCGGVWGSPVVDTATGLLYFGTANCPAVRDNPKLPMEEITALRAKTGARVWTFRPHQKAGAKSYDDKDEDFGATPNLFVDKSGRKVLGAGSKDGSYYALDPRTGKVLWNTKVVTPAPGVGGFIGSPAVWRGDVFGGTAISFPPPTFHSFDGRTGAVRWQGGGAPTYAATSVANGVVFTGSLDFTFKALDAATGRPLWAAPTLGAVSSGAAVIDDMVVVGTGTSTSDACAKDNPTDEACVTAFDTVLGQQGALHAFRLAG